MTNTIETNTLKREHADVSMELPTRLAAAYTPLTQSYYRSIAFQAMIGINPLLSAAASLIALKNRLKTKDCYDNINNLYQHLIHEVKAFETSAKKRGYRSDTILIARYIICASVDETIATTAWGQEKGWHVNQLLKTFQTDDQVDERFFLILDRLLKDPFHHIDLLEFIYVILSLGFEGKFRREPFGKKQLDSIVDELFLQIKLHRPEPDSLFLSDTKLTLSKAALPKKIPLKKWWQGGIAVTIVIYLIFNLSLGFLTKPLGNQLQLLNQLLTKYE